MTPSTRMTTGTSTAFGDIAFGRLAAAAIGSLAVWEVFARLAAPLWLGHALEPTALIEMAFGIGGAGAQALHIVTGLVAFPLGYVLVVRPLARRVAPALPWWLLGAAYGVALWIFAMYVVASLIGGAPAFLGFGAVAWASLVGHVALGLTLTFVVGGGRR